MADDESSYEYACQRAELLGLDKPDKETFLKELAEKKALIETQEDLEIRQLIELQGQGDDIKNVSGGLDELNSILTITQKKINRFKTACGSLTNLLKLKVGQTDSTNNSPSHHAQNNGSSVDNDNQAEENSEENDNSDPKTNINEIQRDFGQEVDSQVDKLDSLIMKAERAQYSMQHQNKQMKSFLHK